MKHFIALFLAVVLFSTGLTAYAKESTTQKPPVFQYATVTEQNKDLFDMKNLNKDRLSEYYGRAVLLSPENHKDLVVNTEASWGIMRSDPQYKAVMLAVEKRKENNQKTNPFYKKSDSYVRFPTLQLKSGRQGIPANLSAGGRLIIYTKPDGTKWNVKKGQKLSIKYALDFSAFYPKVQGISPGKEVSIGYIKNNKMYELGVCDTQNVSKKFEIPVTGEIEFYMLNQSYVDQVLANGSIEVLSST